MSSPRDVMCGVPQESVLRPLLFLIYVNDMKSAVNCKLLLYADDSTLVVSGYNHSEIKASFSQQMASRFRRNRIDSVRQLSLLKQMLNSL